MPPLGLIEKRKAAPRVPEDNPLEFRKIAPERDDGSVFAFEIKAGGRVPGEQFEGLRKLRDTLGDAFVGGAVLYLGQRAYQYEDRLWTIPADKIWTPFV